MIFWEMVARPSGPVAQLVEHRTFNAVVAGSSPARLTIPFNDLANIGFLTGNVHWQHCFPFFAPNVGFHLFAELL